MRKAFIQELVGLAARDKRILLLTADLGFTVVEPFAEIFPDRFINAGVAEQNMVGMATGLAASGFIPFLYATVSFASLRAYEFIRNGPVLHKLPVRIIGIGEGFDYGCAGVTHFGLEDIGLMRMQEGMTVVVPADNAQAKNALNKTWNMPGPVYYRIGKTDVEEIGNLKGRFKLGSIESLAEGRDCLFVCMGSIAGEVALAAQKLKTRGIAVKVVVVSGFNPSPVKALAAVLKKFPFVITVEEHFATGGLGSFVSEIIAENKIPCRLIRRGISDFSNDRLGDKSFLNRKYKLTAGDFVKTAIQAIKNVKNGK
jgi:transketolase